MEWLRRSPVDRERSLAMVEADMGVVDTRLDAGEMARGTVGVDGTVDGRIG